MGKRGLPVISVFSGGLGLDLGLEKAGFAIRVAVECNRFAADTSTPDVSRQRYMGSMITAPMPSSLR